MLTRGLSHPYVRVATVLMVLCALLRPTSSALAAPCDAPANEIVAENCKVGNPMSEWDVPPAGDTTIQGFTTDISVDQGRTIGFKIKTGSTDYRLDIYRLGYYGGSGARRVAVIQPSATLPQPQPPCLSDLATGLIDCGNWSVSASWSVPSSATSGIYVAKAVREDRSSVGSHIVFVVRDDDGGSDLLFQTSDTTWQAYNRSGGQTSKNSLYRGSTSWPGGRAVKVSYNRPFDTRSCCENSWLFSAEYPMVRWLERNGYDVSYFTDLDTDRRGSELLEHRAFLSVGHDEYWSAGQRAWVEAARAAGINLAFFSGNEIYWKTRWEASIDGSNATHRTLVSYKEGTEGELPCGTKCDPLANVWTGLWRNGCQYSPPADGCRPENALSGQISWVGTTNSMEIPAADGQMRFWRNTDIATLGPGQVATLPNGVLGYEWDYEQFQGFYPPGRVTLSETSRDGQTHRLSLYRHASGALVFGAGTVQWSWGLDGVHDGSVVAPDARMQQATVNLLADMGAQPMSLQSNLVAATQSTDFGAPVSTIDAPANGSTLNAGAAVAVSGTAVDAGGGMVGAVEISTDGGATWTPAQGRGDWTYTWTPSTPGSATIKTRATDDSGNLETPGPGVTVTVAQRECPCSLWSAATVPPLSGDGQAVELGVKFRADSGGFIAGLRFYKGAANTGTHVGHLWQTNGTMLAEAVFTGESASGWQEVRLASRVAITANTTYIASYHAPNGHYAQSENYFATGWEDPPLRALANGGAGANGVYRYGPSGSFPDQTFNASNYWVDVVFDRALQNRPPVAAAISANTDEDTPVLITLSGSDPDADALSFAVVSGPANGTLGSPAPPTCFGTSCTAEVTYTPNPNDDGPDAFSYQVSDGYGTSSPATVDITVTPVNDPPVAVGDAYEVLQGQTLSVSAPGVLANDTDADGDPLIAVLGAGPAHGTVTLNANGSFSYAPVPAYDGPDAFSYQVSDGYGTSSPATVDITVTPVNDPPVAVGDAYEVLQGQTLSVSAPGVLANDTDADGDPLIAVLGAGPAHGTVTLNANGSFSYAPVPAYDGPDTFSYTARDGVDGSNTALVTITVLGNVPPGAPTGLTARPTSRGIDLDWQDNAESDLAGYIVYRSPSATGAFTRLNTNLHTVSAYTDTGAPPGQTSFFRVTAVDLAGNESAPATISAERGVIAFRSASSASVRASSLTILRPQGLQPNDVMVASIDVRQAPVVIPPPGWILLRSTTSTSALVQAIYFVIAGTSEPTSYTWSFSSVQGAAGAIVAYAGADPVNPVDTFGWRSNASSAQITAPSVTTTSQGGLLIGFFGIASNPTIAPPNGMLEQVEVANSGQEPVALEVADQVLGNPGATGLRVAAAGAPARNIGHLVALRPIA